jgi:DNA polymerase-4
VFLRGRYQRYSEVSKQIMAILRSRAPVVEQASVDEAYLDITGTERALGPPGDVAQGLKAAILDGTGLTASIGMAPNRFLSKIASDMDKPDGLTIIAPEMVADFLRTLPVGKIPGVGPRGKSQLAKYGVATAGDVAALPRDFWLERLGKWGGILHDRAMGIDDRAIGQGQGAKSVGAENTFSTDTTDRAELAKWLRRQAERVGESLRRKERFGRTVTLKVKYADFTSVTRRRTLNKATNSTAEIFETAVGLLDEMTLPRAVRLIGLSVSNFHGQGGQAPLLPELTEPAADQLDTAVDAIRSRFGREAVQVGRIFKPSSD